MAPRNLSRLNGDIELLLKGLPLDGHGSIFVAQDRKKLHLLKALVVGPVGSPYEGGCFEFDMVSQLVRQTLKYAVKKTRSMTSVGNLHRLPSPSQSTHQSINESMSDDSWCLPSTPPPPQSASS